MEYYSVTPFPPKKVESYHLHYMDERGFGSFMLSKVNQRIKAHTKCICLRYIDFLILFSKLLKKNNFFDIKVSCSLGCVMLEFFFLLIQIPHTHTPFDSLPYTLYSLPYSLW